jgi:hypothetical protein
MSMPAEPDGEVRSLGTIPNGVESVSRFDSARQLMAYCGAVPSEDSSGKRTRRGSITKTGNAHLRRIVVEAAWSYHRPPGIWYGLRKRQESISEEVKEIAWKATTPSAQPLYAACCNWYPQTSTRSDDTCRTGRIASRAI